MEDSRWANRCRLNTYSPADNPALPLNIINDSHSARVRDGDIASGGHWSRSRGWARKGRALFPPDISLTACRYLSVLIRAVAGVV